MNSRTVMTRPSKRPYMVAVVLGTALSALGAQAALAAPAVTDKAVADISRYCSTCWRNARLHPDAWTDCTQEVFSRLLERVTPNSWDRVLKPDGDERREFLRAIDAVKKRTQRSRKFVPTPVEGVADRHDADSRRLADEREAIHQAAVEVLSERQQRILQLSFEGWSVSEIAAEMTIPVERVSDEKYKAIRRLQSHLLERSAA